MKEQMKWFNLFLFLSLSYVYTHISNELGVIIPSSVLKKMCMCVQIQHMTKGAWEANLSKTKGPINGMEIITVMCKKNS